MTVVPSASPQEASSTVGVTDASYIASQRTLVPLPEPLQIQSHGPVPYTGDGVPAVHSSASVDGGVDRDAPPAGPQMPVTFVTVPVDEVVALAEAVVVALPPLEAVALAADVVSAVDSVATLPLSLLV